MKFWSFIGFILIGLAIGMFTNHLFPSLIAGVGVGILSAVGISLLSKKRKY